MPQFRGSEGPSPRPGSGAEPVHPKRIGFFVKKWHLVILRPSLARTRERGVSAALRQTSCAKVASAPSRSPCPPSSSGAQNTTVSRIGGARPALQFRNRASPHARCSLSRLAVPAIRCHELAATAALTAFLATRRDASGRSTYYAGTCSIGGPTSQFMWYRKWSTPSSHRTSMRCWAPLGSWEKLTTSTSTPGNGHASHGDGSGSGHFLIPPQPTSSGLSGSAPRGPKVGASTGKAFHRLPRAPAVTTAALFSLAPIRGILPASCMTGATP